MSRLTLKEFTRCAQGHVAEGHTPPGYRSFWQGLCAPPCSGPDICHSRPRLT